MPRFVIVMRTVLALTHLRRHRQPDHHGGSGINRCCCNTKLHSKIEQGDQEDSDGGVLLVRRSRADAGNEAI